MNIVLSDCPTHDEGTGRGEDSTAYDGGRAGDSRCEDSMTLPYILATENFENFLELMHGLDNPPRYTQRPRSQGSPSK